MNKIFIFKKTYVGLNYDNKSYAQEVAKKWCECGGDWNKIEE